MMTSRSLLSMFSFYHIDTILHGSSIISSSSGVQRKSGCEAQAVETILNHWFGLQCFNNHIVSFFRLQYDCSSWSSWKSVATQLVIFIAWFEWFKYDFTPKLGWLCFLTRMTVLCAHIDLWLCLSVCECAFGKCLHLWQLRSTETIRGHAFYFFKICFCILLLFLMSSLTHHKKIGVRKK